MNLHDKLRRLGSDRNKAEVSRRAGLPENALASLLGKPGTVPAATTALRLARALNVDLEWLLDDDQGWPPVWVNRSEPEPATAA